MAGTTPTIAATSSLAMVLTAEARGVRTDDLLEGAGLTRAALEDPDTRIPAPTVLALWGALCERAEDPSLQLVAPTILPFGAYRVIDYLVDASETVGEGIRRFARYFGLISETATATVEACSEGYCLCLSKVGGGAVPPVYVDYTFAAVTGRVRQNTRPALRVSCVDLRRPEPAHRARYEEVFAAPVRFGAIADRLCFDRKEWEAPIEHADAALARILDEHARILTERMPDAVPESVSRVHEAILAALPESAGAPEVASALHMSVRTLQRQLAAEGTTFREVSEAVRGELAKDYLTDRDVSMPEVAFLLGFSDQSSFNRAFRRWTGVSPGRWRTREAEGERLGPY